MEHPVRKKTRLSGYDYSAAGTYFITLCTKNKAKILCEIVGGSTFCPAYPHLSQTGIIAEQALLDIESHYDNVRLEKYIIMPNHIHMLLLIEERINPFPTAKSDIPNIVGKFKAAVTRNVGKAFMPSAKPELWQSSFYDHIVRGQKDYDEIWKYIDTNPDKWKEDKFFVE